jgi:predicted O-methyltransferase YrrM
MSEYQFTKDWFNWAPEVWQQLIPHLPERKAFLEIGSFEGRSTTWIVENMMEDGGWIDCVDTWEGGEEHDEEDMDAVLLRFRANAKLLGAKYPARTVCEHRETSQWTLAQFVAKTFGSHIYDFIYIDGSHIAKDVLTDACMAWPLLKPKGMMVFDDYLWTPNARDILHRPKAAIDAFTNIFAEEAEIVHVGYQLVVRKKEE